MIISAENCKICFKKIAAAVENFVANDSMEECFWAEKLQPIFSR